MIRLKQVSKYYASSSHVELGLRHVDLSLELGEFVVITGESGSGKSTLLNVLSGLDTFERGTMYINNTNIAHYTIDELEEYRRQYVGFVFQEYYILEHYTVLQNVEMSLMIQGYNYKERRKRAISLLKQVKLEHKMNQKANTLSGGEKQRTVIARALAKDPLIIVCDEPTGNLDHKQALEIYQVLHNISREKLVIIVSHDFESVKPYATRKIRMFDGEIIEDSIIKIRNTTKKDVTVKPYYIRFYDAFHLAFQNVINVPKKTLFTMVITMFIIASFLLSYGSNLQQKNTSRVYETPYFSNATKSRIVVTKYDETPFMESEMETLNTIEYVRGVLPYDLTLDTTLKTKYYHPTFQYSEYIAYNVMPAIALNEFDLIKGRLPEEADEVVMEENDEFQVGDNISLSNALHVKEHANTNTDDYLFRIVGITDKNQAVTDETAGIFFTTTAINMLRYDALNMHNQRFIRVDGTYEYTMYQELRINDTLDDYVLLGYDAMFFDMCRDFKIEECVASDFVNDHSFEVRSLSRFEAKSPYQSVEFQTVPHSDNKLGQAIYVNTTTYQALMEESPYQISVIVYDMYEANQVIDQVRDLGYSVHYPHGVVTQEQGLLVILRDIQLLLTLTFAVTVIYFVGYFVMRNVMMSKRRDYLIYRSIGASKKSIELITILEILMSTIISFVIVMSIFIINEQVNTPLPRLLRYFRWYNYIIVFTTIIGVMYLMTRRVNKVIFKHSVIESFQQEVSR